MTDLAILRDPRRTSLKRLAYVYSRSKPGSAEEAALQNLLLARILREIQGSRLKPRTRRILSSQLRFL